MDSGKKQRLEGRGWKVGSTEEFLALCPEESAYISIRLALAAGLRARRREQRLTQVELARRVGSSQSRVARMEAADPSVSLDLLVRSLLALGISPKDLASTIRAA